MSKPYRHFSNAATALVGAPDVCATRRRTGRTEYPALDGDEQFALEVRHRGLAGLFGKCRDDPTLREICEAAYQERDADVRE